MGPIVRRRGRGKGGSGMGGWNLGAGRYNLGPGRCAPAAIRRAAPRREGCGLRQVALRRPWPRPDSSHGVGSCGLPGEASRRLGAGAESCLSYGTEASAHPDRASELQGQRPPHHSRGARRGAIWLRGRGSATTPRGLPPLLLGVEGGGGAGLPCCGAWSHGRLRLLLLGSLGWGQPSTACQGCLGGLRDGGEMVGRWQGDSGEVMARWRPDGCEMAARWPSSL